jgi:hypothetical protein
MADVDDAANSGVPDAKIFRRAGLTEREASRLAAIQEQRDETRSPWESAPIGVFFWLLWRLALKGFQPLWMIASLAVAAWFATQIVIESGGVSRMTEPDPGFDQRLHQALAASIPADTDPHDYWLEQMNTALDGDYRRRADIETFRAWASIGPDLIGHEQLILAEGLGGETAEAADARFRASPAWVRGDTIERRFRARMREAARRGFEPAQLIFAPDALVQKYQSAGLVWSIAQTNADAFFRGQASGQLELTSLPGLAGSASGNTRLYGGVRHLVMQACTQEVILVSSREECAASIIPRQNFDPVRYGLAALESGLVRLNIPDSAVRDGAEVLMAARVAGLLDPSLEASLEDWLAVLLTPADISREIVGAGQRLDMAFAAPRRIERHFRNRMDRRTGAEAAALGRLLETIARLRRATSPTITMRILSGIENLQQADQLLRISALSDHRVFALHLALGDTVYDLLAEVPPAPIPDESLFHKLYASLFSAALVLLLTIFRLSMPPLIRQASRLNSLDAKLTRLFLGRKT